MRRITKRTAAITTAGAVLLLAGTGVAYAYWTAGGSGTGSATTGAGVNLTVNQTATLTDMFPGDTAQGLSGNFDNTTGATVAVTSVTASIASVTLAGNPITGCSADDYTLAGATMSAVQNVPVGTGVGSWSGATIKFHNTTANQDACKGATVTLAYVVA
jgi:hypothetical protein